jgi:hypothetical protein
MLLICFLIQVFFVDYLGSLCSKDSGHAVDVDGTCHFRQFTIR